MNKKFLLEAARLRRESLNAVRRQAAKTLERRKAGTSLFADFSASLEDFILDEPVSERITSSVSRLIRECHVTADNIRDTKETPGLRWRNYLDPMYNTLRGLIARSSSQGDKEQWREFWVTVSTELRLQLDQIAVEASVRPELLGKTASIVEDEMRNTR